MTMLPEIINNLAHATIGGSAAERRYTLHSHTEFCDGRAQIAAFAAKAAEMGFKVYGFTPHSPLPITSPCNMHRDNVHRYFAEVDKAVAAFGDKVKFLRSMEIDYLGPEWGPAQAYFRDLPLDYRLASVHFIPSQSGEPVDIDGRFETFALKMGRYFRRDIRYVVETFYNQSMEMVSAGGFDIIGHFDKVGHNASHWQEGIEEEPWYVSLVESLLHEIIAKGVAVEINTKALADHKRFFPAVKWWKTLFDAGVPVVVNSDAHVPALIDAGRAEAFAIIDNILMTPALRQ